MNWLDVVLIAIVLVSVASGFAKGFVRLGVGFGAAILGFLLAAWFYRMPGAWLAAYVGPGTIANILGFLLIFVAVILLGAGLSALLAKALHLIGLGFADRLGGAVVGAIRGVLVCVIVIMVMVALTRRPPNAVVESTTAPYLVGSAHVLARLAPYELREGMRRGYEELRRTWNEMMPEPPRRGRQRQEI